MSHLGLIPPAGAIHHRLRGNTSFCPYHSTKPLEQDLWQRMQGNGDPHFLLLNQFKHGLRHCPGLGIRWLGHARRGCRKELSSVRSKWWYPEDLVETGKCEKAQEAAGLKESLGCFTLTFMLRTSMESTYRVWWQAPSCTLFFCLCILTDFFPNTFLN